MRRALYALVAALFLAGPALAEEAAPKAPDLPFEFIPREFHGKWVLTDFHSPPISPSDPTDPYYFVGKGIEVRNSEVKIFGHRCKTRKVETKYWANNEMWGVFQKHLFRDFSNGVEYPFVKALTVYCDGEPTPTPSRQVKLFLDDGVGRNVIYISLYNLTPKSVTLSMPNGPEYILRPVE